MHITLHTFNFRRVVLSLYKMYLPNNLYCVIYTSLPAINLNLNVNPTLINYKLLKKVGKNKHTFRTCQIWGFKYMYNDRKYYIIISKYNY